MNGACMDSTDAYNASICAPILNGSHTAGNTEYANMIASFLKHLLERYE